MSMFARPIGRRVIGGFVTLDSARGSNYAQKSMSEKQN
jgi:hypothetical protein